MRGLPVSKTRSREARADLRPISTTVEINSLPYTPSLVGRTISLMSVHMLSQPGPEKGPLYPIPRTWIFPVAASSQIMEYGVPISCSFDVSGGDQYSSAKSKKLGFL